MHRQNSSAAPPFTIEPATLTDIVRRALDSPTGTLGAWQVEPLTHRVINRVTAGLQRVRGTLYDQAGSRPWSLVLKVLCLPVDDVSSNFNGSEEPGHWNYWRREADVYRSGLLDDLGAHLVAPHCFGVTEPRAGVAGIWLEDIQGSLAPTWPLARFGLAAQHLGQMQGAFVGQSLLDTPWLSQNWLRAWVLDESSAAGAALLALTGDTAAWQHPLVRQILPVGAAEAVLQLWHDRETLLAGVERIPRTLCHFDFRPPNLFARRTGTGDDETVLIDWSMVGPGALGEDIANLVLDSGWMFDVDSAVIDQLEHYVVEGYLTGLHDAGWRGNPTSVRFSYAAVAAVRFALLAGALLTLARDQAHHAEVEQRYGKTIEVIIATRAVVVRHAIQLAEQARALLHAW